MKPFLSILNRNRTIIGLLFILFFIELLRTAWISDDAKITLRTVLNLLYGYGPTFNIDERVQAYTHPLWFLLLAWLTCLARNIFYATFILSIGVSLTAFGLFLTKFSKNITMVVIIASALMLSKSFVDFSTSGLENPLSNLLLIFLVLTASQAVIKKNQRSILNYFLICSCLYLCRADLTLLILPLTALLMIIYAQTPKILIRSLLIGALPAILWTAFSLYYYGFLFPNTAYAKLLTGIPLSERIEQGIAYLIDSVHRDPLTLIIIFLGICAGIRNDWMGKSLSIGITLYLFYIVFIGGDFMTGRFLSTPFFLAAIQLSRLNLNKKYFNLLAIVIFIPGLINIHATLLSNARYSNIKLSSAGISDERGFYFQHSGLLNETGLSLYHVPWLYKPSQIIIACGSLGGLSLASGPGTHLVDICALADPLLSHMPISKNKAWRAGHFIRTIPEHYLESIEQNKNLLTDPALHQYYDSIRTITRGDLNDPNRWREIVRLNFEKNKI